MHNVFIISAKRTPIGKFLGSFSNITAVELGAIAVKAALEDAKVEPQLVDEVIFGNARQAGNGPNPARQVAYKAGIPISTPAFTINKACASSLKSISLGYQAIVLGDADIVLAGGTENMTRTPFIMDNMRFGYKMGRFNIHDGMYKDGFLCPLCGLLMGETAENLTARYRISREDQDKYAYESQRRYKLALDCGKFKAEITPVKLQKEILTSDEHPKPDTTLERLSKLSPVFKKDGTITPGNACGITDGASAVVLASAKKVSELGLRPLARIIGYSQVGVDPSHMGIGPVDVCKKLEKKIEIPLDRFDLIELNEAFAVQVLACQKELEFDLQKINVNGGAIAMGHPIGATGARIVTTLVHEMQRRKSKLGLATLCVSGGLGMAVAFEAA